MLSGEHPERLDDRDQLASGILRRPDLVQVLPQQPEALEEHLPDQSGLVAEQLVYGRSRGARALRQPAGGELRNTVAGQHVHGSLQHALPHLRSPLLRSRHRGSLPERRHAA